MRTIKVNSLYFPNRDTIDSSKVLKKTFDSGYILTPITLHVIIKDYVLGTLISSLEQIYRDYGVIPNISLSTVETADSLLYFLKDVQELDVNYRTVSLDGRILLENEAIIPLMHKVGLIHNINIETSGLSSQEKYILGWNFLHHGGDVRESIDFTEEVTLDDLVVRWKENRTYGFDSLILRKPSNNVLRKSEELLKPNIIDQYEGYHYSVKVYSYKGSLVKVYQDSSFSHENTITAFVLKNGCVIPKS